MSETNDGGPVFPCGPDVTQGQWAPHPGMSLRDYFAGQAMSAMLSCYQDKRIADDDGEPRTRHTTTFWREMGVDTNGVTGESDGGNEIAADAYAIADAMLRAREGGK